MFGSFDHGKDQMSGDERRETMDLLGALLQPWHAAVQAPAEAQRKVLAALLKGYAATEYGRPHGAAAVDDVPATPAGLPGDGIRGLQAAHRARNGRRGGPAAERRAGGLGHHPRHDRGESKFIPMTPTDLRMRVSAGRAMMNYVASATARLDLFHGVNLNLNFPSVVGTVRVGDATWNTATARASTTKHVSAFTPIRSVPTQEDIDALGGGKIAPATGTRALSWPTRQCRDAERHLGGGVAPTALLFGRYLRRVHRVYPRDLWKTRMMTLGSVPGINTRYEPALRALYGPAAPCARSTAPPRACSASSGRAARLGAQLRPVLL